MAQGRIAQTRFCALVGISRTTLWRLVRPRSASRPRGRAGDRSWEVAATALCQQFPAYGYRMIAARLHRQGIVVGLHRLRRWMRTAGYAQTDPVRDTGRTVGEKPAAPRAPNQACQMDATKVYTTQDGWLWQTSVLDCYDRRIVAHVVRKTCRTEDALDALVLALEAVGGDTLPPGLAVIHDRGSQFTAWAFTAFLQAHGLTNVVTAVRHPQSCGRLERWHRTLKAECLWLQEWETLAEVEQAVGQYVAFYNRERLHSALAYQTPWEVYEAARTIALVQNAA